MSPIPSTQPCRGVWPGRVRRAARGPLAIALFLDGWLEWLARRLEQVARTANVGEDAARHARARRKRAVGLEARANGLLGSLQRRLAPDDLDWSFFWWWHPYMRLLLSRYDVIQAYATYTTIPFIAGREDFAAYEHGTIRAIPFAEDTQGRLVCRDLPRSGRRLRHNSDNLEAAARLRLDPSKVVCLPHAFDSGKLLRFADAHPAPVRAAARTRTTFFSPSRQDWQVPDPSLSKGNDRAIRALEQVVRQGRDCGIEFIEWGTDVQASKALVAALGLEDRVTWLPKMKKRELWAKYLEADCVIDQFVVPAMGGVTFEAMMLGRRVISSIDEPQARRFFGEPPPLFNAASVEEIADAMLAVATDAEDLAGRGRANQDWMRRYHSQERIVALQAETYRRILGGAAPRDVRTLAQRRPAVAAAGRRLARAGRAFAHNLSTLGPRAARLWQALRQMRFHWLRRKLRALPGYAYRKFVDVLGRAPAVKAVLKSIYLWLRHPARPWNVAVRAAAQASEFVITLWRYRAAWRPRPVPGALAGLPPEVVMLVVSDLRIDPRVERAARTMAAAGYRVKVIWPEPKPPFHADQPIDWGPGIAFRPLAPEHYAFVGDFPWVFGQGMFEAAIEERPRVFHCHD